ncbi:MAG TPA: DUF4412 domain-containing protein [Bacteroidia bacterium]|nr:DUF4412 domain-containing protein [Bacteroidia bacterium]
MLRKLFFFLLLISVSARISAQNFEGIIEFKKQTGTEVLNYVYYVKGDRVRIDEFTPGTRTVSGSFILDVNKKTMIYLNHDRKLWGTRQPPAADPVAPAGCIASATKNSKTLFGYKCTENIVKNVSDSTQISYWVANGHFAFFTPMMKLLNRQEKFSTYFFAMTLKDGAFPFLAVESDLNGKEISRLEVTRFEQKTLDAGLFSTPKDYTEVK